MAIIGPTTDHDEIRAWAEANHASPAEVKIYKFDGEPSMLRFVFGDFTADTPELHRISWQSFFAHFDVMGLSLVYEAEPRGDANRRYELLQKEERDPYQTHRLTN